RDIPYREVQTTLSSFFNIYQPTTSKALPEFTSIASIYPRFLTVLETGTAALAAYLAYMPAVAAEPATLDAPLPRTAPTTSAPLYTASGLAANATDKVIFAIAATCNARTFRL